MESNLIDELSVNISVLISKDYNFVCNSATILYGIDLGH